MKIEDAAYSWLVRVSIAFVVSLTMAVVADGATGRLIAENVLLPVGEDLRVDFGGKYPRALEVRAGGKSVRQYGYSDEKPEWRMELRDAAGLSLVGLSVYRLPGQPEYGEPTWKVRIEVDGAVELVSGDGFESSRYTTISLLSNGEGAVEIWAGDDNLSLLGGFTMPAAVASAVVTGGEPGNGVSGELHIVSVNVVFNTSDSRPRATGMTASGIANRCRLSADPREGIYEYLDSDIDLGLSRRGGDYILGVVGDGKNGYDLIYLGGARENSSAWTEGMTKGSLTPTIFVNHYNLSWYDADKSCDMTELWAEFNGPVLELHFPNERAIMRFSRRPVLRP